MMVKRIALLVLATGAGACLGTGHVYRGIEDQAVIDMSCPHDDVEVEGLDAMNEHFRATGCGKEARYDWVDGKPVLEGDVHPAPPAP